MQDKCFFPLFPQPAPLHLCFMTDERYTLPWTVLRWHSCIIVSSETHHNRFCLVFLQAKITNQRRKYLFVSAVIYFPRHLQKAPVQIAFLIRIKEEVSLLGWECEAFAVSMADAICAESGEQLILATAATRFTDLCGDSFLVNAGFSPWKNTCSAEFNPTLLTKKNTFISSDRLSQSTFFEKSLCLCPHPTG